MSLLFPSLVAGPLLLLLGVPLLIHLIQLLRHRRVEWAAMDFLLASQKRHRKWIRLKQLLLLAARVAVLALLLLMLAQPIVQDQWGRLLGGQGVHHIVLLDDSFSMSDLQDQTSAFDRGKRFVQRLIDKAAEENGRHAITLLRYSRSASRSGAPAFDWLDIPIDRNFRPVAEEVLGPLVPSETAAGPAAAIGAVDRMPEQSPDETRHLYLLSDFRRKDWSDEVALRTALQRLGAQDYQIHLVQCVDTARPNLVLSELTPRGGVAAAGVEMMLGVTVRNYGERDARQVAVRIEEDGHARPTVLFDRIGPGETASHNFRVRFPAAGPHTVTAHLPADVLADDNRRFCVVNVPERVEVLLVDSAPLARDAHFVATALAPGGHVDTGLRPVVQSPAFLRRPEELDAFAAIYLLNIDRLDDAAVEAIEGYVRGGGGVAFFLGDRSKGRFFTERLYRGGEGLFPAPVAIPTNLLVDRVEKSPDLVVTAKPG
ncbi:MAG: BatA domain-containing protein, partial [Pirellulales bacterium]